MIFGAPDGYERDDFSYHREIGELRDKLAKLKEVAAALLRATSDGEHCAEWHALNDLLARK